VRPDATLAGLDLTPPRDLEGVACDLRDAQAVVAELRRIGPVVIFHAAGVVDSRDVDLLYDANVRSTVNLLSAVDAAVPAARVVVPGSAAEYGPLPPGAPPQTEAAMPAPASPYGLAKAWQTTAALYFATRGLSVCVGRIFNLIGPGVPPAFFLGNLARQLAGVSRGEAPAELHVGDLDGRRDFVDVRDACDALIAIADRGRPGTVYNICSGQPRLLRDVLADVVAASGLAVTVQETTSAQVRAGIQDSVGSHERLTAETGWQPRIPFAQSVHDLLESVGVGGA